MVVATADSTGQPAARYVLLKGLDERGLVFYTNYGSAKGVDLEANPVASVLFPWHALERQVRITGPVSVMRPRARRTSPPGRTDRRSAPGRARSRRPRVAGPSSTRRTRDTRSASRKGPTCRGRTSGVAIAWRSRPRSSGRAGRTGCTTACATAGTTRGRAGASSGSGRDHLGEKIDPRARTPSTPLATSPKCRVDWPGARGSGRCLELADRQSVLDESAGNPGEPTASGQPPHKSRRTHALDHLLSVYRRRYVTATTGSTEFRAKVTSC